MTTHREELEQTLATAPFAEIYGFVLFSIEDDSCTLRIPFRPVLERPGGVIAGPVYMAAADVSIWLAIKARYGDESWLTSSMVTHFCQQGAQFGCVVPRHLPPEQSAEQRAREVLAKRSNKCAAGASKRYRVETLSPEVKKK